MKSFRFWVGVALVAFLCSASFGLAVNNNHQSTALSASSSVNLPASLLTFAFGGGGGWGGGGGNGGGSGCGQGGNGGNGGWGGNGGNGGNGGWGGGGSGGNGGGCSVPEGGGSLIYLALAALACVGAMAYRAQRRNAMPEIK